MPTDPEKSPTPKLYRLRRRDVAVVVALGLTQAAALVAFLLLTAAVIDSYTLDTVGAAAQAELRTAVVQLLLLVGVALAYGGLRAVTFSISEKVGYDIVRDLRLRMYEHLGGMMPRQLQRRSRGGLLLRITGDLSMLRMWISRGILGGLVASILLVGTIVVLVVLDPWIGLAVVTVLAVGAAVSLASGEAMRSAIRRMRRRRSLLISNIDEQINSLHVVQVFGRTRGEHARLSRQNDSLNTSLHRVAEVRGRLRGIAAAWSLLAVVAVLAVGLLEIRQGTTTVGFVVAASLVTHQLTAPVRVLGLAHDYWHRGQVSSQKINDFLRSSSTGVEPPGLDQLQVRGGRLELREVTVPDALRQVTLTAEPGQLVAVTGPSGAGKSTLLALVARAVEPSSGEVAIDGQALSTTTPRSLFRHLGAVSPDLPLMRGSVRRNLTYRMPRTTPQELQRVVLALGLDELLARLPDGLDTWLTEGGANLSAGQRQLIALCRALLGAPRILLLDEPTAHLDSDSAEALRRVVARYRGTVLLASHDPADLALADQVWVLDRGRVADVLTGEQWADQAWLRSQRAEACQPLATS